MKIKYVIIDEISAILLPDTMQHRDFNQFNITGAGFCGFGYCDTHWTIGVFGKSVSLNIHSKPEDADIIRNLLNNR